MFKRPEIDNNDAFDAGGTRFEVVTPFEELRTTYDGKVDAARRAAADGRTPARRSPRTRGSTRTSISSHRGVSPMYGGEPVNDDGTPLTEDHSGGFARGHYEQHMAVTGTIRVGDEEWIVERLRPPRPLVGPALLAGAVVLPLAHRELRRRLRLRASRSITGPRRQRAHRRHGAARRRVRAHPRRDDRRPTWEGDDQYHAELRATATTGARHLRDHRAGC